jgi:parallel beta-helix repeat protein
LTIGTLLAKETAAHHVATGEPMKPNCPKPSPGLEIESSRVRSDRSARTRRVLVALVSPLAVMAGCGGSSTTADAGKETGVSEGGTTDAPKCVAFTSTSKESDIAGALATAKDGTCFDFAAGTYKFNNQLAFGTGNDITVTGAGIGKTIFDFSSQVSADDSIYVQSVKNLVLQKFSVVNTPGNAVKTLSVTGLTFDTLGVSWTGANASQHGAYGLYPVSCKNVLIQNSQISGAADSGIYVGQSQEIVVRNNEAFQNVAGIEIENSYSADVYGNTAHDNTAGILVFALPNLPQDSGHSIRVHANTIENNNTPNFAAKGDIVSILPAGSGTLIMACDHVEFFGNTYSGNKTGALAIVSYYDANRPFTDDNYYPYASNVYLHDDTFMDNGTLPDRTASFGLLLFTALGEFPGGTVADVFYDGVVDPKLPTGPDPMHICIQEPHASSVCDLNLGMLNKSDSNLASIMTCSTPAKSPFDCMGTAVPAVSFPGLTP